MTDLSLRYLLFGEDRTASASMKNVGKAADDVGTRVKSSMVKIGEGVGAAIAGVAALSVHNAMVMQESDAKIQGSAQISAATAKSIGDAFLATAGTSTFSGKEMADAFGPVAGVIQEVSGRTLTAADSMTVMRAATTLAEASGNALSATTGDLAAVMQSYHLKLSDAAAASDILFNTSRLTNVPLDTLATTVDKLHGKLGIVSPSLADMGGLMVDLANHGISGSRGLMVINTGMTSLLGGSKATTKELANLGVKIYDANGKFVGMDSVLQQLTPKLAKMTDKQRLLAEQQIFGKGAALALNSTIMGGAAAFDKATGSVLKHGTAEDAAKAKAGTLQGQMKILLASFTDITTQVGQRLIPVFTTAVTWLDKNRTATTVLIGSIGLFVVACTAMTVAARVHQVAMTAATIGKGAFALATGGATIASTAETIALIAMTAAEGNGNIATKLLTGATMLMNAAWEANPIGVVIVLVAALVAGVIYAYTHFTVFRNIVNDVWHAIATGAQWMWNSVLKPTFSFLINAWMTVAGALVHGAAMAFGWVPGLGPLLKTAAAGFDRFRDNVNNSINGIQPKTISVKANFIVGSGAGGSVVPGIFTHAATGGAIRGSGTGTSDSIFGMLSNGEHVLTADDVNAAGGHQAIYAYRKSLHGFAGGGAVFGTPDAGAIQSGANVAWRQMLDRVAFKVNASAAPAGGGGGGGAGGAAQWASTVLAVLAMLGQPSSLLAGILRRINFESGGNPNAQNNTDSNAMAGHPSQGLMQTIPSTFAAYAGPFASLGIRDPMANIYAGIAYATARYGSAAAVDPLVRPYGYDQGGYIMPGLSTVYNGTGKPEWASPPGAGTGGPGGSNQPIVVQMVLDGRVLHQSLLQLKRTTGGGLALG
jgi:TP901 family phage tail tape measure protein